MNVDEIVQALLDGRDQQSQITVTVNLENPLPYKISIRPIQGEELIYEIDEKTMIHVNNMLIGQE
jgi:hypothetical protein